MKLTLGQAAKHAKRSKGTISNALNNGQLSGDKIMKRGGAAWQIDPAELQRWMDLNPSRGRFGSQETTQEKNAEKYSMNRALEVEVKMLREQMAQMETMHGRERDLLEKTIEEMQASNRQAWAMIADQTQKQQSEKRGFFRRMFAA